MRALKPTKETELRLDERVRAGYEAFRESGLGWFTLLLLRVHMRRMVRQ